jgi:hypothetical protein
MKLELKTIVGELIFEGDFSCIADLVRAAIAAKKTLRYADLRSANLRSANLRYADLRSANLSSADLRYADLSSADLRYADLSSADLRSANLRSANLSSADLSSADLRSANLSSANLSSADLSSANLSYANLSYANLSSAKNAEWAVAATRILPDGALIGWKKCRDDIIVKLRIPEAAKRSHAFGRKCRAEFVEVLEVIGTEVAISQHDGVTQYKAGETVKCDKWCEEFHEECAGGIHFFITKIEAEKY